MNNTEIKRISIQIKCPNPLFEKWLVEWRNKAAVKGSKMIHTFDSALDGLRRYPLPLDRGIDCKILKGFGNKLCNMLDDKLSKHKKFGLIGNTMRVSAKKQFLPQYGSGDYNILMVLYIQSLQPNYSGYSTKSDIILHIKQFIYSSFTKPNPHSLYTTWNSMKTLTSKDLVLKVDHPPRYSLTEKGLTLVKQLYKNAPFDLLNRVQLKTCDKPECNSSKAIELNDPRNILQTELTVNKMDKNTENGEDVDIEKLVTESELPSLFEKCHLATDVTQFDEFYIPTGNCDIILYVDLKENIVKLEDEIITGFSKHNIHFELKDLKVGDFVWVCRDKNSKKELVLPYVVERKRMDDFASSIKDKRYHEQKFRLKRSGVENLIYLVENYGKNQFLGLPLQTLYQAASYTAIQDKFYIKFTGGIDESLLYLVALYKAFVKVFKNKTFKSCKKDSLQFIDINQELIPLITFKEFNESSIKNKGMKVTDLFVKMLIQIKGVSVHKALAITKVYPTPASLRRMLRKNSSIEAEKLLSSIKYEGTAKDIGSTLSKTIYQFFMSKIY